MSALLDSSSSLRPIALGSACRWLTVATAIALLPACGDEPSEPDDDAQATSTDPDEGDETSEATCEPGTPCTCPDGNSSIIACVLGPSGVDEEVCMCIGGDDEPPADACGVSVTIDGAVQTTYQSNACGGFAGPMGGQATFGFATEEEGFGIWMSVDFTASTLPVMGVGEAYYDGSDGTRWEAPDDSCTLVVDALQTVGSSLRITGSASCPEPAVAAGQADIVIADFDFVAEVADNR